MEKFFNEKCGLLYWNADLMWTFLSKKVHMWTFGAKCGPIWQHCIRAQMSRIVWADLSVALILVF